MPRTSEDWAKRVSERAMEVIQVCFDLTTANNFPSWVRTIAANMQPQIFPAHTIASLRQRDDCYMKGFVAGMLLAVEHACSVSDPAKSRFPIGVGNMCLEKATPLTEPVPAGLQVGRLLQVPELRNLALEVIDELVSFAPERRTKFFEGLQAGSDLEFFLLKGAFRAGMAFDTQLVMLLFWPELEMMKTRSMAYNFIDDFLSDNPSARRSEETFIRFAKDCGFKSRK